MGIRARGLVVTWRHRQVLGPLDLDIEAGERVALLGRQRSGKSAFLQALVRRDAWDADLGVRGSLQVYGQDILKLRDLHGHRRTIGFVPSYPTMLPGSVYDNVSYAPRIQEDLGTAALDARVEWSLKAAAVWGATASRLAENAEHFSAGERQRIALARALAQAPRILLLDQPFAMLDSGTATAIQDSLLAIEDLTIILATSNPRRASQFATRVVDLPSVSDEADHE